MKNLPDEYSDEDLKTLFKSFGEIRSAKVVKKEMVSNYLGIKRSVKVFGFVCFFEPEKAQTAKNKLTQASINQGGPKLYVDYHQTKQERTEILKLKLIRDAEKGKKNMQNMRPIQGMYGRPIMPKFPGQPEGFGMMRQMMMPQMPQQQQMVLDRNQRYDYYGSRLYHKINATPEFQQYKNYFSKIVGIFLDLEDNVINRLLTEEAYLQKQVDEAIQLLSKNENE